MEGAYNAVCYKQPLQCGDRTNLGSLQQALPEERAIPCGELRRREYTRLFSQLTLCAESIELNVTCVSKYTQRIESVVFTPAASYGLLAKKMYRGVLPKIG